MQNILIRLTMLTVGLAALGVFLFDEKASAADAIVVAGPCQQDCDRYWEICNDACEEACEIKDQDCTSCVIGCAQEWNSCSQHSIYCSQGSFSYNPSCNLQFGLHCVVVGGIEDCDPANGAHNGYSEICNRIGYENGCVVCPDPDNQNCYGSGGPVQGPLQCL